MQPEELEDYGGSLRDVVKAQMGPALDIAMNWLKRWGAEAVPRQGEVEPITDVALAMGVYEAERPPADQAYRLGDARFLNMESSEPQGEMA